MIKLITFILFFSINTFAGDELLKEYCNKLDGKVVSSYQCPKSKLTIPFEFCLFNNSHGVKQFFDGCTGPTGGNSSLFYPSCIKHDLCYHHEPISNGKSQKECDTELLADLITSCEKSLKKKKCIRWAKLMFRAVRSFGKLAYNCADYEGIY